MPKKTAQEPDASFLLKVMLYFILGLVVVRYHGSSVFPLGGVLGLVIVQSDHFTIDRKIEYVILLVASVLAFVAGYGFFLNIA